MGYLYFSPVRLTVSAWKVLFYESRDRIVTIQTLKQNEGKFSWKVERDYQCHHVQQGAWDLHWQAFPWADESAINEIEFVGVDNTGQDTRLVGDCSKLRVKEGNFIARHEIKYTKFSCVRVFGMKRFEILTQKILLLPYSGFGTGCLFAELGAIRSRRSRQFPCATISRWKSQLGRLLKNSPRSLARPVTLNWENWSPW